MAERLVYRLQGKYFQQSPQNDIYDIERKVKKYQLSSLRKLRAVEEKNGKFLVDFPVGSTQIVSSWLANALIVEGPPEIHRELQLSLDILDIHPDYDYYLIDYGGNDINRVLNMPEIVYPVSLWHHEILDLSNVRQAFGLTGKGVKIGILDTGIFPDERLLSKLKRYAFIDQDANISFDVPPNEPANLSHGTHVAGSIVSNEFGIAPGADIYVASVNNGPNGFARWSQITKGLEWLLSEQVHAINLSLGGPGYRDDLDQELQICKERGIAVFAAVGNVPPGKTMYPGNSALTFSVGATSKQGKLITRSGSDSLKPDVVAPGESIYSTLRENTFGQMTGTSQATPQVTGLFALLREYRPTAPASVLLEAISRTSFPLPSVPAKEQGHGLIRVRESLDYVTTLPSNDALPMSIQANEFEHIEEIQIDLASAKIIFKNLDLGEKTKVEIADNNADYPYGIRCEKGEKSLSIFSMATQVSSDYEVTISTPPLEKLHVGIISGTIDVLSQVNVISIATTSADINIGSEDSHFKPSICSVKSVSGKISLIIGVPGSYFVEYNTVSGRGTVISTDASEINFTGAGRIGDSNAPSKFYIQTVSRDIVLKEIPA